MPDKKQPPALGDLVTKTPEFTLADLCETCEVSQEQIISYVSEGIIEPHGSRQTKWRFSRTHLIEVRRATRLEHDLGLNAPGIALAFDLLGQIEELKRRLQEFERDERTDSAEE